MESSKLLVLLSPNVTLINVHVVFSFEKYNLIIVGSQSQKNGKSDFAVDEEKIADRIGITGF